MVGFGSEAQRLCACKIIRNQELSPTVGSKVSRTNKLLEPRASEIELDRCLKLTTPCPKQGTAWQPGYEPFGPDGF